MVNVTEIIGCGGSLVSMGEFYELFMEFITESLPGLPLGNRAMCVYVKVTGQKCLYPWEALKEKVD